MTKFMREFVMAYIFALSLSLTFAGVAVFVFATIYLNFMDSVVVHPNTMLVSAILFFGGLVSVLLVTYTKNVKC